MPKKQFASVMVVRWDAKAQDIEFLTILSEFRNPDGSFGPIQYKFPGGMVEEGESAEDAAIRELREETGIVVRPQNRRHLILANRSFQNGVLYSFFVIERGRCGGRLDHGVKHDRKSRITERRWVSPNELIAKILPTHAEALGVAAVRQRDSWRPRQAVAC